MDCLLTVHKTYDVQSLLSTELRASFPGLCCLQYDCFKYANAYVDGLGDIQDSHMPRPLENRYRFWGFELTFLITWGKAH